MAKAPKDESDWASLPVLTEIVGDALPEIPILTDEARNKKNLVQDDGIVEMSAEEIAALLAPQLEKQLRAKLSAQFELMWQETWRQARAGLPDLIRTQLTRQPKGLAGVDAASLDIIPSRTLSTGSKKNSTGKASSSKLNIKEPKKK